MRRIGGRRMKIGMLTSGGDCQALNAAMRGVAKSLYNKIPDVKIYGFLDGYKGLISSLDLTALLFLVAMELTRQLIC